MIAHYALLSDYPYRNRTEHVHIGLVVFRHDGEVRVHLADDLRKVRAINPRAKIDVIRDWEKTLPPLITGKSIDEARLKMESMGNDWRISEAVGKFAYENEEDYLHRVTMALTNLVSPAPRKADQREPTSRLHTDLRKSFIRYGWLGKDIKNHEIVTRYSLGPEVTAEFALMNGRLHVIETLDLRTDSQPQKRTEARSKALAFDMAKRQAGNAACYAVMAGMTSSLAAGARELLQTYADHVYAWESPSDMNEFFDTLGRATGRPMMALPKPN